MEKCAQSTLRAAIQNASAIPGAFSRGVAADLSLRTIRTSKREWTTLAAEQIDGRSWQCTQHLCLCLFSFSFCPCPFPVRVFSLVFTSCSHCSFFCCHYVSLSAFLYFFLKKKTSSCSLPRYLLSGGLAAVPPIWCKSVRVRQYDCWSTHFTQMFSDSEVQQQLSCNGFRFRFQKP